MIATAAKPRRGYGTGSLLLRRGADGREVWYGRWRLGEKRLNRRIGLKRRRGTGEGLTRSQAEAELRCMMVRERPPPAGADIPFRAAAELMLRELEELGRKSSTLENYRSILRAALLPRIGEAAIRDATPRQIEAIATELLREGKAARTRAGALKLLSQVFSFAQHHGWCREIPAGASAGRRFARAATSASSAARSWRRCWRPSMSPSGRSARPTTRSCSPPR